jgi:hypothetical protein
MRTGRGLRCCRRLARRSSAIRALERYLVFTVHIYRSMAYSASYQLENFLRRLTLLQDVEHWSLMILREKLLVKIGTKATRYAK